MGIGKSVDINVDLNHANGFYYAGDQVTGTISIDVMQKKLLVTNLYIEFIGECNYERVETLRFSDAMGHVETNRRINHHVSQFVNICCPLISPQNSENKKILYRGHYSWPFEFTLPEILPASLKLSTNEYPYVQYYLNVVFQDKNGELNRKRCQTLTVFPQVILSKQTQPIHASFGHSKSLQLEALLPCQTTLPGDNFVVNIHLVNPKGMIVQNMQAYLIQHSVIAQQNQSDIMFQMSLPSMNDVDDKDLYKNFCIKIPSDCLPPTHSSTVRSNDSLSTNLGVHYELKFVAQIDEFTGKAELSIPIIVGTELLSIDQTFEDFDNLDVSINYVVTLNDFDSPPDYESTM